MVKIFSWKIWQCVVHITVHKADFVKEPNDDSDMKNDKKMKMKSQMKVANVQVNHCLLWQVTSQG